MFWPILISAVSFWSVALAGGLYLGRRYVRALEVRNMNDRRLAELAARVEMLEAAVPLALPTARSTPVDLPHLH